jgi:hypothetical protein
MVSMISEISITDIFQAKQFRGELYKIFQKPVLLAILTKS